MESHEPYITEIALYRAATYNSRDYFWDEFRRIIAKSPSFEDRTRFRIPVYIVPQGQVNPYAEVATLRISHRR